MLHYVFGKPDIASIRGNPQKVLDSLDEYSNTGPRLMTIGPEKGAYIDKLLHSHKPSIVVELGAYVGYSAVKFGSLIRQYGAKKYISIELNPVFAAVSKLIVELAGLQDFVEIIIAPSYLGIAKLLRDGILKDDQFEFVFIDHWKQRYVPDLMLLEKLGVLKKGSVIVADNILMPGAPEYKAWVTASTEEKKKLIEKEPADDVPAAELVKLVKASKDDRFPGVELETVRGNPDLVYQSHLEYFTDGRREDEVAYSIVS